MKLKKFILLLMIIFITGCSVDYNLTINNNNTIEESITVLQPNSFWGSNMEEVNEQIDWTLIFGKDETEPAYFYDQQKIVGNSYSGVKYNYQFNQNNFKTESEILSKCFDYYELSFGNNMFYISASKFKCSSTLGNNYDLTVNITVSGEVIRGNYDKKNNNKYTWDLTRNDDINIELVVDTTKEEEKSSTNIIVVIGIVVGIIILLIGVVLVAYKKNRDNNN